MTITTAASAARRCAVGDQRPDRHQAPFEPVDAAPAGDRGGVLEFLGDDGDTAEIEIMEPSFDDILDRIVYAPLSKLPRGYASPAFEV